MFSPFHLNNVFAIFVYFNGNKTKVLEANNLIKPFLRWAGGKTWLLKHLDTLVNQDFLNYHEPFLGGGAIFLNLRPPNHSFLSDLNNELIDAYCALKEDPKRVISELKKFENTKQEYYKVRSAVYRNDYRKAARFIFLNQTSFNGIYRVNLNGEYNVPYGYRQKTIFTEENLLEISSLLQQANISMSDFSIVSKNIKKNDLVFLDPPYTVAHNNNGFIKYNQKIFSLEDQYRLGEVIDQIKAQKAFYILTNAAHSTIEEIFEKGDTKLRLARASRVGGLFSVRGNYDELLFTNISIATDYYEKNLQKVEQI